MIDVSLCIETVVLATTESWTYLWIPAGWRNFLWLYIWGGSGSAGGASCPLQSGGRLLCGYNMAGQVYCLERGCALVLSRLRAGTHCVWRMKTLTVQSQRVRVELGVMAWHGELVSREEWWTNFSSSFWENNFHFRNNILADDVIQCDYHKHNYYVWHQATCKCTDPLLKLS